MFRRLIGILLLFGSVALNLSGFFVLAGFEFNRDYVARELCVNRDKPQLHCNGKCYLIKKLKQAQDKEEQETRQIQKIQLQEATVSLPFLFNTFTVPLPSPSVPLCTGMPVARVTAIFHPPQV
jgi:hypothetical protein